MSKTQPAWCDVLDDLERALSAAEQLLREPGGSVDQTVPEWTVPEMSTPVPEGLVTRAWVLHRRQRQLIDAIGSTLASARHDVAVLGQLMSTFGPRPSTPAVYLDFTA